MFCCAAYQTPTKVDHTRFIKGKGRGRAWLVDRYTSVVGEMKGTYYAILGQVIEKPDNDTHEKHYYDSMVPAAAAVQVGQ